MKINNMTAKTSLEIEDSDILVIQDGEDTKQVSVADFKEYLSKSSDINTKKLINQTIDNVVASLNATKYVVSKLKTYLIGAWIGSSSGNIQIILKDKDTDKWLTEEELKEFVSNEDFNVYLMLNDILISAVSFNIKDFITEHPSGTNPVLESDNAGFIKAHFDNLTQNDIASITYENITISYKDTEDFRYMFEHHKESFINSVPYEESI